MRSNSQKGFGAVEIITTLVIVAVLCIVGWRVYEASQDEGSVKDSSPKTENTTDETAAPTKNNPGDGTQLTALELPILEWGVTIADTKGLTDLAYSTVQDMATTPTQISFTTQELKSLGGDCSHDVSYATLGAISRSTVQLVTAELHTLIKKIGDYYYYYYAPQVDCGVASTSAKQAEQLAKFKEAIKTLKAIE